MKNADEFLNSGQYLPPDFRDFHAQKDLFKMMFGKMKMPDEIGKFSWVQGHIFIVDVFLWFMARRGYTLQKSRVKVDFVDLDKEIRHFNTEQMKQFSSILNVGK